MIGAIDVFKDAQACTTAGVARKERASCLPFANRSTGEVQVAFEVQRANGPKTNFLREVTSDDLRVSHGCDGQEGASVDVIPHQPFDGPMLLVLLIDGTMGTSDGVLKVKNALLKPEVLDPLFSRDVLVVPALVTDRARGLDGGDLRFIKRRGAFEAYLKENVDGKRKSRIAALYNAVDWAVRDLVRREEVKNFISGKGVDPTVVLVSHSFHRPAKSGTCADLVRPLQRTLNLLGDARRQGARPVVHTIGLGRPYRKGGLRERQLTTVTPQGLCGKMSELQVKGSLDKLGVDTYLRLGSQMREEEAAVLWSLPVRLSRPFNTSSPPPTAGTR